MSATIASLRPVYVIGIGMHRYQPPSETSFVELGLTPSRAALLDAGLDWKQVDSAYVGRALLPMAVGRPILRHLGATGLPITHVENASASGSAAFRLACMEIACGMGDISLVLGVDKPVAMPLWAEALTGIPSLVGDAMAPVTHFALLADAYMHRTGCSFEDIARVAVKNLRNASLNPFAQRQQAKSLEEVTAGKKIAGLFTSLQCTPFGEGGAAVLVASEEGVRRAGLNLDRAVRVTASATHSQRVYGDPIRFDELLTQDTIKDALSQAGISANNLDIIELHDAFTIEELVYLEGIGACESGQAAGLLKEGAFDIGGRCAVNPSGGLIGMGHPIGPTGVGQIAEITRQLRGEAGERQQPGAKTALAHMVGLGAVCYAHVLQRA